MIYIDIPGAKGSVTDGDFVNCSQLQTYGFTANCGRGTDAGNSNRHSGRPSFGEFTATKRIDAASPTLLQFLHDQKVIPNLSIFSNDNSGKYLAYELYNVIITSRTLTANSSGAIEHFKMSYDRIEEKFYPRDSQNRPTSPVMAMLNLV